MGKQKLRSASILLSFFAMTLLYQDCSSNRIGFVGSGSSTDASGTNSNGSGGPSSSGDGSGTGADNSGGGGGTGSSGQDNVTGGGSTAGTGSGGGTIVNPTGTAGSGSGPTTVICDPLTGGLDCSAQLAAHTGLLGNIYFLDSTQASLFGGNLNNARLADYLTYGHKVQTPILMSQIDVPDHDFSQGFSAGGNYVVDTNGNKLIEYFAIDLHGYLLVDATQEGLYQFALNSDDGSKLFVDGGLLIDDDGTHSVRFVSSTTTLTLDAVRKRVLQVQYYQGPRVRIAFELYWRKCLTVDSAGTCVNFDSWVIVPANVFFHD